MSLQALPNMYIKLTIFKVIKHKNVRNNNNRDARRPSIETQRVKTLIITTPSGIGMKPILLATRSE